MDSSLSSQRDDVLVFGPSSLIETCGAVLGAHYRLANSSSANAALTALARSLLLPALDSSGRHQLDFISHRRSWYACPECKKVWIGKRQEDF